MAHAFGMRHQTSLLMASSVSIPTFPVDAMMGTRTRLIPVLHVENVDHAEPLLEALVGSGVTTLEVTLRSECAVDVIKRMLAMNTGAIVGAGTITRPDQFERVVDAGAMFGVSPALTPVLGTAALESALPFVPGVCTPTEALLAREMGFHELKFFPADLMGGIGWIKHMLPLYPDLRFCPTGGTGDGNLRDYLALPNVFAVGGAFLAPRDLIESADWSAISARSKVSASLLKA